TRVRRTLIAASLTGMIVAYDIDTRRVLWRFLDRAEGSATYRLAADEHTVYVPYFSGSVIAIDLATGKERWRYRDRGHGYVWISAPWVDGISLTNSTRVNPAVAPCVLPRASLQSVWT